MSSAAAGMVVAMIHRRRSELSAVASVDLAEPHATAAPVLPPFELPRGRRPGWATLAALAAATGAAALGLGGWALVEGARSRSPEPSPDPALGRAIGVLADPTAERVPLRASLQRIVLVFTSRGDAVLALRGLGPAPEGRAYQTWVVPPASTTPIADAVFDGSAQVVPLARTVYPGARVAVTLEAAGGARKPTRTLRLIAQRP